MTAIYMFSKRIQICQVNAIDIDIGLKTLGKMYVDLRAVCSWKMDTNPPIFKDVETMIVEPDATHDESVKGKMYF